MIFIFEGPSAVGKTTLCQNLQDDYAIIPEVYYLFETPKLRDDFWYYEKQVERFEMACRASMHAILDGDPFQPLWYNWTYGFPREFPGLKETVSFYRRAIKEGRISFPDFYIVLQSDKDEIVKRKQSDKARKRRNFEKHKALIRSQRIYFDFLKDHTSVAIEFLSLTDIPSASRQVSNIVRKAELRNSDNDNIDLERIEEFLTKPYLSD